jgi:hypothetical protein
VKRWFTPLFGCVLLVALAAPARAADVLASVGSSELEPGEATNLTLTLQQDTGEAISALQASVMLLGYPGAMISSDMDGVPDPLTVGDTWDNGDFLLVDDLLNFNLESDPLEGERLIAELELVGLSAGAYSLVLDTASAFTDIDEPPFTMSVPVNNKGATLASITVVPEPSSFALVFLGLASLAARRSTR